MNTHCSNEVFSENRPKIQMQSWIIFERKIGKSHFFQFKMKAQRLQALLKCSNFKMKRSTEFNWYHFDIRNSNNLNQSRAYGIKLSVNIFGCPA